MKIKILANDGISKAGIDLLEKNNYEVKKHFNGSCNNGCYVC